MLIILSIIATDADCRDSLILANLPVTLPFWKELPYLSWSESTTDFPHYKDIKSLSSRLSAIKQQRTQ